MINLEQDQLDILKNILQRFVPEYEVRLFGSRITDQSLATKNRSLFTFALSESDLRYKVDVVEWCDLDDSFQQRIASAYEVLQNPQG
ncbi:MAG: hypothetical protein P1U34_08445 [Coxiellaceae bacterium]|nr:hypothetical protein [Coxiellaceae bacterium]